MDFISLPWHWLVSLATFSINLGTSIHVVFTKRDSRSAIGWVAVIWLTPFVGPLLYFLFGINRIRRRAQRLRLPRYHAKQMIAAHADRVDVHAATMLPEKAHLVPLVHLLGALTRQPLLQGNRIEPLHNGDQAYPAMLQAIHEAQQTIGLSTYIFNNDRAGGEFVEALRQALARGVEVRVLIDDIGVHYSWHTIARPLRKAGVTVAFFLPKLLPWYFNYANLCNHRKLLIVDGRVGFTGGMNISEGNALAMAPSYPVQDMHFRIDGPVVARMQEIFADDWEFSTGELLSGERWFPELDLRGPVMARGVTSGPDEDLEKMRLAYLGALACAHSHVHIMTPYFLPDPGLIAALNIAALRGVNVDILLPRQTNLHLVQWASMGQIEQVLEYGCKVWLVPPPFAHTKLMLVDGVWSLIGSANWDPRSLRLNFEFNVECYDSALAATLEDIVQKHLAEAQPLSLDDVKRRSFAVKLRDGVARLFTPYL